MSIVLIGYRGSGKTTVGRLLAQRLGWPFIDLDERIVVRAGMTIKQIFQQQGEAGFRRLESAALCECVLMRNHVISLGGGAILAEENRIALAKSGHQVIYLRADPAELHRRIVADPVTTVNRPHLTGLGGGIEEITSLLTAREPLYRQVMTTEIDVMGKPPAELVELLLAAR